MTRIFKLCFLLCCAFSLTACLGGGGGGDGGGGAGVSSFAAPSAMYADRSVKKQTVQVSPGQDSPAALAGGVSVGGGALAVDNSGSIKLYSTADPNISFTIDDSKVVLLENGVLKATYNSEDQGFKDFIDQVDDPGLEFGDFTEEVIETDPDGSKETFTGTINPYGDAVLTLYHETDDFKLDYSTFGAWAIGAKADGTVREYAANGDLEEEETLTGLEEVFFEPIHGRVDGQYKAVPAAAKVFEGPITAMVYKSSVGTGTGVNAFQNFFIEGTARMKVIDPIVLNEATLILPGFYDIKWADGNNGVLLENGGFVIESDGFFGADERSGITPILTPNNTKAGFEMTDLREHEFIGQFYGSSPSAASEATGEFSVIGVNSADRQVGVRGAFGVK